MKKIYNAIIQHGVHGPPGEQTHNFIACGSREEAEAVLAQDASTYTGPAVQWQGSIEELYVKDEDCVEANRLRLQWVLAEFEQHHRDRQARSSS